MRFSEYPEFWKHVAICPDGCWEWIGTPLGVQGYGCIPSKTMRSLGVTSRLAHRAVYVMRYGPIPNGLLVCHRCDNPPCVRPDHLCLGTNDDNMRDKVSRGRAGKKLTEKQVRAIRSLYAAGRAPTMEELAAVADVDFANIHRIIHRRIWRHVA
jgi:hypothetical protein